MALSENSISLPSQTSTSTFPAIQRIFRLLIPSAGRE
jgi:hypothetical protein